LLAALEVIYIFFYYFAFQMNEKAHKKTHAQKNEKRYIAPKEKDTKRKDKQNQGQFDSFS
jgi:hypothetical protein